MYFQSGCSSPPNGPQPSSLPLTGSTFVITFFPGSGGSGSATYTADPTFTVYPAYKVLNVVYVPIGNKSVIGYTTTATNGSTTKISDSFQSTTSAGASVGFTFTIRTPGSPKGTGSIGSSQGVDFGLTTTTGDSSSFTENFSSSSGVQFQSTSNTLDHTKDWIFVWLNPAVTLTQRGPSTVAYSLGVPSNNIGTDPNHTPVMDIVPATVAQFQDPKKMAVGQLIPSLQDGVTVPGLLSLCKNAVSPPSQCTQSLVNQNGCGCTPSDFADIVKQNPFFQTGVPQNATPIQVNQLIPNRFAYINTQILEFGVQSTYIIDDKTTRETAYSTTNQDTVSWSQGRTFTLPGGWSIGFNNGNSWTWTDTMETTKVNTLDHIMTAFLSSTTAACYTNVDIYMDTVYHTYLFVPDSISPSACP
jgi:hypothetical protein